MAASTSISEPAILLKPTRLYRRDMSEEALYDITRGVWRVKKERAAGAMLAFAVVGGAVVEVYTISAWHAANTTTYLSGRRDQSDPKYADRLEFRGSPAPSGVRSKYLGLPVNHLFGRGQVVAYVNC